MPTDCLTACLFTSNLVKGWNSAVLQLNSKDAFLRWLESRPPIALYLRSLSETGFNTVHQHVDTPRHEIHWDSKKLQFGSCKNEAYLPELESCHFNWSPAIPDEKCTVVGSRKTQNVCRMKTTSSGLCYSTCLRFALATTNACGRWSESQGTSSSKLKVRCSSHLEAQGLDEGTLQTLKLHPSKKLAESRYVTTGSPYCMSDLVAPPLTAFFSS